MTRRLLVVTVLAGLLVAPAGAHQRLKMAITINPATPVAGTPARVTVRLTGASGSPVKGHEKPLALTAEMTAHPMPPVEALLTPTGEPDEFAGNVEFAMGGAWRVTVEIEQKPTPMRAVLAVQVSTGGEEQHVAAPAGGHGTQVVSVETASQPTMFRPWTVVIFSVGLLLAAETAAGVARWIRRRRSKAPTASAGSHPGG